MIRIFYPEALDQSQPLTLDKAASHHLLNVLRFKVGDPLEIFNGEGGFYLALPCLDIFTAMD